MPNMKELFVSYYVEAGGAVSLVIFAVAVCIFYLSLDKFFQLRRIEAQLPSARRMRDWFAGRGGHLPAWFEVSFSDMAAYPPAVRRQKRFFINRYREVLLREMPAVESHLDSIAALVSAAPLLGLLGTVVGMVETFSVITDFGMGNPFILSRGISTALLTTQTGLLVAFPGLLIHTRLSGYADRLSARLLRAGDEIAEIGDIHV
ncbi:MAG: MotA/TolQ/ExbB proton channel family protein [Fibrobacterota bacterium]